MRPIKFFCARQHLPKASPHSPAQIPLNGGKKRSDSAFFTEEDFDRPTSSRQAFYRLPFSALLFGDFAFSGLRDEGHRTSRIEERDHTLRKTGRKVEDKSNGSPPATLWGLLLFSAAMGPRVSEWPPFRRLCGPPRSARHPLQHPEQ